MAENIILRTIIGCLSLWFTVISPLLWIYWTYAIERKKYNQRAIVGICAFFGVLFVMYLQSRKVGFIIPPSWGNYNEENHFITLRSTLSSIFALIITITVFLLLEKYNTLMDKHEQLTKKNERSKILVEGNKDILFEHNRRFYRDCDGKTLENAIIIRTKGLPGSWHFQQEEYYYIVRLYGIEGIDWTMEEQSSSKETEMVYRDLMTIKLQNGTMVDIFFKDLYDFS